jgi:hypothetical protein
MAHLRIAYLITGAVCDNSKRLLTLTIGTKVLVCGDVDETGMVEILTEDHVLLNVFASDLTERSDFVNERAAAAGKA